MDFFKEFSRQLSGKGRSNADKNREEAELGRLTARMRDAEDALEQLYARYGRACYQAQAGQGNPEAVHELALRIRAAELEVNELTAQADAARTLKRCAHCGAVFGREARYCSACGKKLPEEPPKPEPMAVGEYCPACGARREDDAPACPVCGAFFELPAAPGEEPEPGPAEPEAPAPEEPDGPLE